ncbi:HelD family protein [Kineococcus gynurae]|uniref:HelD family protein n=1 Tax=Kineococcus gynurae TaxID=452979 RepID=A0ABV5LU36_9ACTN
MTVDPVLAAEQAHLETARTELARMREHTRELTEEAARRPGDAVADAALGAALARRAAALVDDPGSTLFFGRTDLDSGESLHIGRRHVMDTAGDPVVIDWRADVSRGFYSATRDERHGVVLRRRFGVDGGRITAYEDEHLLDPDEHDAASEILAREIERPRSGPMRDIVATIQPEQDALVRADARTTVCVQGAPGTGKTAVGLHRAAWLLYAHRERLTRQGVLVIGPNHAFLQHIAAVLPALGEVEVEQATMESLLTGGAEGRKPVAVRAVEEPAVARLKGDARMAAVLHRAVWSALVDPTEPLVLTRGSTRWRVPAYRLAELVAELRTRGLRYEAARDLLPARIAHVVLQLFEAAGDSPDDRVQDAVARSADVKREVKKLMPPQDAARVLWRVLAEPEFLAACAEGVLDEAEQELLRWTTPPRTPGSARWTAADAVLLDEVADQLSRTPSRAHVVLDEAQDLSAMQLRAVGRRCTTGAATVLGDIAQGTTPWAAASWDEVLDLIGKPEGQLEILDRGFRVPSAVIDYAATLLPWIAPDLTVPRSVRTDPGRLDVRSVDDPVAAAVKEVRAALAGEGSVGVVLAAGHVEAAARELAAAGIGFARLDDPELDAPQRVSLVPAGLVKGLEFDRTVVVEPSAIVAGEPDRRTGLRRLYVALTRAVSAMTVVHADPLPEELG